MKEEKEKNTSEEVKEEDIAENDDDDDDDDDDKREKEKRRFQIELEFVQCLANPHYLHFLAQQQYFKDASFINYLSYLRYWGVKEYACFLKYPQCLKFLELLQHEHFRSEISKKAFADFISGQQFFYWLHAARSDYSESTEIAVTETTS